MAAVWVADTEEVAESDHEAVPAQGPTTEVVGIAEVCGLHTHLTTTI